VEGSTYWVPNSKSASTEQLQGSCRAISLPEESGYTVAVLAPRTSELVTVVGLPTFSRSDAANDRVLKTIPSSVCSLTLLSYRRLNLRLSQEKYLGSSLIR